MTGSCSPPFSFSLWGCFMSWVARVRRAIRNWWLHKLCLYFYRMGYFAGYNQGYEDQASGLLSHAKLRTVQRLRRFNKQWVDQEYEMMRGQLRPSRDQ